MRVLRPMATVSSTDNYVTVLSIPDESSANAYGDDPPTTSKRMSPAVDSRAHRTEENGDGRSSGRFARQERRFVDAPRNSPKQRRRIEFDDSARYRAKSCHERLPTSVSESEGLARLKRDRAHKSGYFNGLSEDLEDELDEVPPEIAAMGVRAQRIVFGRETTGLRTGISVTGVPDSRNPDRLSAAEIIGIEEDGRVALNDQLRVGDRILKINSRPVYQMSLTAARLHLEELKREEEPSILFYRLPPKPSSDADGPHFSKPIVAEVQQGNTAAVHDVLNIAITKTAAGFQFGFAGRFSTEGTIFLITHVNPSGPSADLLKSGDRLLKIGPTDITHLEQHEVTQLLRNCEIGDQIEFQISRTPEVHEEASETPVKAGDTSTSLSSQIRGLDTTDRILELRVPVNETAAAGLGLVLKGRSSELDDAEQGAGVYIDRILQGSAAYKDGRLREGDRLLGIENFCLLRFARNSDAAHAFHRYVAELSPSCAYFRVFISRAGSSGYEPNEISRTEFTRWMNAAQKPSNASRTQDVVDSSAVQTPEETADSRMVVPSSPMAEETASVTSVPVEPFNRESATRRSFSEKGPTKMRVDPSQFENFRRIAHQRQVSAPAIGHRRHRAAELQRQRSAGLIKRLESKAPSPPAAPLPKNSSFSLRTFFGRRSARKEASKKASGQAAEAVNLPDKENHNADAQQLETKRRSMSGEPQKSDQLRYSSRSHENMEPAQNMSPSTMAARDLSRKKRRSVGNSVLKFFQRADPSPQLGRKHDQESPSGGRADQFKAAAGPPMYARPIAHVHHRRFGSAHEGFQHEPVGVYNWGRAVDPRSVDGLQQRASAHRLASTSATAGAPHRSPAAAHPAAPPPPYGLPPARLDYYGAFNQWFAGTTAPHAGADPHRQQRFGADYWNNAVVPVHYAPTYAPAFAAAAPVEGDPRAATNWCAPGGVYEFNRLAAVTSSLSRSPRLAHSYDTTVERL